jgi:hypothetical protein
MMNNYRVVLGYLKKVAVDAPDRELLEHIKKYPSSTYIYLDEGWLKPEDEGVKQAILEDIKQKPSHVYIYLDKGWLKPEDEGVKRILLEDIKKDPFRAEDYLTKGWLKPEDEGVKQVLLEYIKEYPSRTSFCLNEGWLKSEDEEFKQALLELIKKYPFRAQDYLDKGWLKLEDEGVKQALLELIKENPSRAQNYIEKGWLTQGEVNNFMSETFKTPVEDFSHSHSSHLAILQKLRSLAKKNGGKVGVIPQFKSLFSGREFLTVADIDKLIDKDKKHNKSNAYEFDHRMWGKHSGQNSFEETQLVIQVKSLPSAVQSEIDSTDYLKEFMSKILELSKNSSHPRAYGWARVHVKDKDTWVIDEIQSDVIKAYNDLASNGEYAEKLKQNAPLIMNNLPAIGDFVKKHFKGIRDVIISAVRERAHKAGVDNIEHMNVEFKVKQNLKVRTSPYADHEKDRPVKVLNSEGKVVSKTRGEVELGEDTPIPVHYVDTYLKDLEKDGFERDEQTQRFKIHSSLDWFLGNHD